MAMRILLACLLSLAAIAQAPQRTWITDVNIVSPERLDRIERGSVLIEDGRIARVERGTRAPKPAGATIVEGHGQFLIPGLIDSHVHLFSEPGTQQDKGVAAKDYFRQLPRSYLYFGYTTLVDLAVVDRQALIDFRNAPLHPDLYDCGPSLPIANGYPMSFGTPAERFKLFPNFIYDASQAASIPAEYKTADHTPSAAVATVQRSGGVCVKTYFERGFGADHNLPVITPAIAADIRTSAHQAGLVMMMHANSFEAQKFAVDANVDVVAHGMWNWGALDKASGLPPEITAVLDSLVQKKIGYQATIQVIGGLRAMFDRDYLNHPSIPNVIPAELLAWFKTPDGKWFAKELNEDNTQDSVLLDVYDKGPLRRVRAVVAYLASKDANFVFGTDTPSAPTYGNLPGLSGFLEMQQLRTAGLSLQQIFRAATINNAREFKLDSQLGTIEAGKVANLVLLKKSPLESVDAYDSIVTVWIHGKAVSREACSIVGRSRTQ